MQLRLENISVRRRDRALLDGVSLTLEPGQLLALLGPNGAGKTTLLRVALGLLSPDRGQVRLGERSLNDLSARERAARVAWLPQHSASAEALRAVDVVASARYRFAEPFAHAESAARAALVRVGVGGVAERALSTLSGGERQRVALAGLLAQDAPILLVDEPANHLDPAQQIEVYRLLGELWQQGRSVVCVTHDVNLLRHLGAPNAVRVAGVVNGKVGFECAYSDPGLARELGALFGVQMREVSLGDSKVLVPEPRG
ncbi:MAG TPA: ABC transporter ATP-binding protein [Polyangiaceae bacterium]|nr:ABC transporter ATP-binding protein [Polyangiaceae bacterium]